jgi:hypothetical protein
MRARKKHTRREIRSYEPDVRRLLKWSTELELPRFAAAVNAYRALRSGKL